MAYGQVEYVTGEDEREGLVSRKLQFLNLGNAVRPGCIR